MPSGFFLNFFNLILRYETANITSSSAWYLSRSSDSVEEPEPTNSPEDNDGTPMTLARMIGIDADAEIALQLRLQKTPS